MTGYMSRGNGVCQLTAIPAQWKKESELELKARVPTTAESRSRAHGLRVCLKKCRREKSRETPEI